MPTLNGKGVACAGAVIAALMMSMSPQVLACSCAPPEAQSLFDTHERIVIARVKRVSLERSPYGDLRYFAAVEVLDTVRSTTGEPLTRVQTRADSAMCGIPLLVGREYLMSPNRLGEVNLCSSFTTANEYGFEEALIDDLRRLRDERREGVPVRVRLLPPKAVAGSASTAPTSR